MKKLVAITALALASNTQAVMMSLDEVKFSIGYDSIELSPPFSRFHVDNEQFPFVNPNYAVDWFFANTAEAASLDGYVYFRGSSLATSATVAFTLNEPVSFSLTGKIRQPDWLEESFTSLGASLGLLTSETSQLAAGASSLPALAGILNVGQYIFRTNGYAYGTESNSEVHLTLAPIATADGGSTLLFLFFALAAFGVWKK